MCFLRMILVALSAFVAGVSAAQAASLSCDEAKGHIGEQATVCGLVASAACTRSQTTFLNLCKPYPNHVFTALIWGTDRDKFLGKCGQPQPEKLVGKNVCVTGKIELYHDSRLNRETPEIILRDPKQLSCP